MSLFGKMIRLEPQMEMPPKVRTILEEILEVAGMKSSDTYWDDEMLKEMYNRLDVIMFFEILTYLPGRHLDRFVEMNKQKKPERNLTHFFKIICRMQRRSLPVHLLNYWRIMCVKAHNVRGHG